MCCPLRLSNIHAEAPSAQGTTNNSCNLRMRRLFLRKLKTELKIPVLALVDSDPYGLKILSVYMKGVCGHTLECRTLWLYTLIYMQSL